MVFALAISSPERTPTATPFSITISSICLSNMYVPPKIAERLESKPVPVRRGEYTERILEAILRDRREGKCMAISHIGPWSLRTRGSSRLLHEQVYGDTRRQGTTP